MATNIPILLSSPLHQTIAITPPSGLQVPMSSSPFLPSPSQRFAKKPLGTASSSREGSVPNRIVTGFTSVSTLLRQAQTVEILPNNLNSKMEGLGEKPNSQERNHTSIKEPTIEINEDPLSVKKAKINKKAPVKRSKKAASSEEDPRALEKSIISKPSAREKKRSKKGKDETQSKIRKGKIIKPGIISGATGNKVGLVKTVRPLKDNNQKVAGTSSNEAQKYPAGKESSELLLAEAVKRRRDWTPVQDTTKLLSPVDPITTPQGIISDHDQRASEPVQYLAFENLFDDYKCAQQSNGSVLSLEQTSNMNGGTLTKRRKIELIDSACSIPVAPSKKMKSPKKKRQTITDKATAPFVSAESSAPNLSQYFGTLAEEKNHDPSTDGSIIVAQPAKAGKRKPKKKALNTTNLRKNIKKNPILLSPETAMRSTNNQDLIFGTSSQLVRDESPTTIKDIQQTAKAYESTGMGSSIQLTPKEGSSDDLKVTTERSSISSFAASRNLWSVAARDSEGSLLNVEVIDLVDTPRTQKYPAMTALPAAPRMKSSLGNIAAENDQWTTIEDGSVRVSGNQAELDQTDSSIIEENSSVLKQPIPRSVAEASLRQRPKSRSPVKKHKIDKDLDEPSLNPAFSHMPNYHGFNAAQLSKDIASYGFKAIKKRTEMIALLERCWESQSRIALQALPTNVNLQKPSANHNNTKSPKQGSPSKIKTTQSKAKATKAKATESTNVKSTSQAPTTETALTNDEVPKKPRGRPRKQSSATSHTSIPLNPVPSLSTPNLETAPSKPHYTSIPLPLSSIPSFPSIPPSPPSTQPLHSQITQAITTFPPTHSATSPSFYERILLYEPIMLENLTVWLNTEGLGRIGVDDEVPASVVKEWCNKSGVCCFWGLEGRRAVR